LEKDAEKGAKEKCGLRYEGEIRNNTGSRAVLRLNPFAEAQLLSAKPNATTPAHG
jgi:hypothetical protein